MGLLEFDKLPINTLVGADWDTYRKVTANQVIDKGFKGKYRLTTGVCRLLSLLKPIEDSRFKKLADKPLEMDPLFILGHWRSGTTFVHNVFACDKLDITLLTRKFLFECLTHFGVGIVDNLKIYHMYLL